MQITKHRKYLVLRGALFFYKSVLCVIITIDFFIINRFTNMYKCVSSTNYDALICFSLYKSTKDVSLLSLGVQYFPSPPPSNLSVFTSYCTTTLCPSSCPPFHLPAFTPFHLPPSLHLFLSQYPPLSPPPLIRMPHPHPKKYAPAPTTPS